MDWNQLLNNFGVPVAVMSALFFGLAVFCKWVAKKVVEPLVSAHLTFVHGLAETQKGIVATQQEIVIELRNLNQERKG